MIFASLLAGCALPERAAGIGPEVHLFAGDAARVDVALERTVTAFIGPTGGGGGGGTSGSLVSEIPPDLLTKRSTTTPWRRDAQHGVALGVVGETQLHPKWALSYGVRYAKSDSTYVLPKGAGVLTDPIRMRFETAAFEAEARLGWAPWTKGPRIEAGLGRRIERTQTRLRSALLRVDHDSTQHQDYTVIGLRQRLPLPRSAGQANLALGVSLRSYGQEAYVTTGGVALRF